MSDLIPREDALNAICGLCDKCISMRILNIPRAIDVEAVKHGHYIIDCDGEPRCSACGARYVDSTKPYCPDCGAKMDEPEVYER